MAPQKKVDNTSEIKDKLSHIENLIALLYDDFSNRKVYSFDGAEEVLKEYDARYKTIAQDFLDIGKLIEAVQDEKKGSALFEEWDDLNASFLSVHQELYTNLNSIYLSKMSDQIKKTNTKLENTLGTQFGIFSALLSLLAFILNNTKLFAIEGLTFNHIIMINLCYLLACVVIFCLVFSFIKPYYHSAGRVWSFIFLIGILALIIGFCYLKFPNIPIIPLNNS